MSAIQCCPFCGEKIWRDASKCKYCGGDRKTFLLVLAVPVGLVLLAASAYFIA